jgi:hypothetical protein
VAHLKIKLRSCSAVRHENPAKGAEVM